MIAAAHQERAAHALWIVNPVAGARAGATLRYADRVRASVPGSEIHVTARPGEAEEVAREAVRAGVGTVAVVGGDGTLCEAANGVLKEDPRGEVALAFAASGTCNDFSRGRPVSAGPVDLVEHGNVRRIDVGEATFVDIDGRPATRYFLVNCTIGLVSAIGERFTRKTPMNLAMKRLSLPLAEAIYATSVAARWRPVGMRLTVGADEMEHDALNLAVMKCRYFGGGMCFGGRDIGLDDGRLEAVLVGAVGGLSLARMGIELLRGRPVADRDAIRSWTTTAVGVETARPVPLELDGEIVGWGPARFRILPRRLLSVT